MSNRVAIVVPVYKQLDSKEKISFNRIFEVFGEYDIYFAAPDGFCFENDIKNDFAYEYFCSEDFTSTKSYNKLLLSISFYKRFEKYEYILICQLDVFCFENHLSYFCDKGYDYIGAPWVEGIFYYKSLDNVIWHVGNGGFSLRKTTSFIKLIEEKQDCLLQYNTNEDFVFSAQNSDDFRVAPLSEAISFAFERQVQKCFKQNNNHLPMAIHAWWKYDLPFLRPYIEDCGITLPDDWCEFGVEDRLLQDEYIGIENRNLYLKKLFSSEIARLFFNDVTRHSNKIVLWGAGRWGRRVADIINKIKCDFLCYCDKNVNKLPSSISGHQVLSPDECFSVLKTTITI